MTSNSPKSLIEAVRYFADPKVCHDYMLRIKFPDGQVCCPVCGGLNVGTIVRNVASKSKKHPGKVFQRFILQCNNVECRNQFTAKTGTIFEDSALPLDMWFVAVWSITNAKNGISSCELARALSITQKSAWHMLHRVREAMRSGSFQKMSGTVEADESYVGGAIKNFKKGKLEALREKYKKPMGRQINLGKIVKKTVVMGMLQRGDEGNPSQVRMQLIPSAHRRHLLDVIHQNVEPGSKLMTDALKGYVSLRENYDHEAINHALAYVRGEVHTNGLENFWALMKRTLKGTYVAVEPFHMMRYLDEQCFRFNNRKETDGERFARVMAMATGKRLTWAELTGKIAGAERSRLPS